MSRSSRDLGRASERRVAAVLTSARPGRRLAVAVALVQLAGLLAAGQQARAQFTYFDPNSAIAAAQNSLEGEDWQLDFWDENELPGLTGLTAEASKHSASARAVLGAPWGGWARAMSDCCGSESGTRHDIARAFVTGAVVIDDPQGRPSVRLRVRIRGVGYVPQPYQFSEAFWEFRQGPGLGGSYYEYDDANSRIAMIYPPEIGPDFYVHGMTWGHPLTGFVSHVCESESDSCVSSPGQNYTEFDEVISYETTPGDSFFQLTARASAHAVAIADPVIEPHPDNPDVVVTMRGMESAPVAGPLDDMTPEDLVARGIDPAPFERVGFFDPDPDPDPCAESERIIEQAVADLRAEVALAPLARKTVEKLDKRLTKATTRLAKGDLVRAVRALHKFEQKGLQKLVKKGVLGPADALVTRSREILQDLDDDIGSCPVREP